MNSVLAETIDHSVPKFNDDVINNLSTIWLKVFLPFVDMVIRSAIKSAPPLFKYEGYRVKTPEEEYYALQNSSDEYEIAQSTVIEAVLNFTYDGELIERVIYIPYIDKFGLIKSSGTRYVVTPVLSDNIISPDSHKIFTRLLRDKLNFESVLYTTHKDGAVQQAKIIFSSTMLRSKKIVNRIGKKVVTPTALYPFVKYGLRETFKRYFKLDGIILTNDKKEIEKLKETHFVHTGLGRKPKWVIVENYTPSDYAILVPRTAKGYENLVNSLLYSFDMIPDLVPYIAKEYRKGNVDRERMYFKALLGRIAYRDDFSLERCLEGVDEHFAALEGYLDTLVKKRLRDINIDVDNFIDFATYLVITFDEWIVKGKSFSEDIYNKYYDILYYIAYNTIVGFNKTINALVKRNPSELSHKTVKTILMRLMSRKEILNLTRSSSPNIALTLAETTSDNMYFTITSNVELQERGDGINRSRRNKFPPSLYRIKALDTYVGTSLFLRKKVPTPRMKINPFVRIDTVTGKLAPNKEEKKIIDQLDKLLLGRGDVRKDILDLANDIDIEEID